MMIVGKRTMLCRPVVFMAAGFSPGNRELVPHNQIRGCNVTHLLFTPLVPKFKLNSTTGRGTRAFDRDLAQQG